MALWREALLAQKILQGQTTGYRHHPQLVRFRVMPEPVAGVATYLAVVYEEATRRGYHFAASKIALVRSPATLTATDGQLRYAWRHLRHTLLGRDPARAACYASVVVPIPHPLFRLVPGPVSAWERVVEGDGAELLLHGTRPPRGALLVSFTDLIVADYSRSAQGRVHFIHA